MFLTVSRGPVAVLMTRSVLDGAGHTPPIGTPLILGRLPVAFTWQVPSMTG
jgi:hypothetical protein